MIEIFRKKNGLTIREIYFAPDVVDSREKRDIDMYVQCKVPIPGSTSFWTSIIDLSPSEEELFSKFSSSLKNEINRVTKSSVELIANTEPSDDEILKFCAEYNIFAKYKGITMANFAKYQALRNARHLMLFSLGNNTLTVPQVESIVHDGYRARMLHGAGIIKNQLNSVQSRVFGNQTKFVVWSLMVYLKRNGFAFYDLGGISRSSELQNIDQFKQKFNGVEVEEYNALHGVSAIGKLVLNTLNLKNRLFKALRP